MLIVNSEIRFYFQHGSVFHCQKNVEIEFVYFMCYSSIFFFSMFAKEQDYSSLSLSFAFLTTVMLATVSAYSVKLSSYLINFFAVAKTVALGIIITVGAIRLGQGKTAHKSFPHIP